MLRVVLLAAGALLVTACGRPAPASAADLRARAVFELGCNELTLIQIDPRTGGVAGCGRRVVYVERCDSEYCRWTFEREVPPPPSWGYSNATAARPPAPLVVTSAQRAAPKDDWKARVPALTVDDPGF